MEVIRSLSLSILIVLVSLAAVGCRESPENKFIKKGDRLAASRDIKKLESALSEYKKALVLNPNSISIKDKIAMADGKLGKEMVRQGMWNEAVVRLEESLEIKPNIANNRYYLALAYINKARIDSAPTESIDHAIAEYKKAISLEPDTRFYTGLAIAYYHKDEGLTDRALETVKQAISSDTNFAYARAVLGRFLLEQEKLEEALDSYRSAARLAEKKNLNEAAEYYDAQGDIYSLMGNTIAAEESRERASELRAKVRRSRRGLGPAPVNRQ